MLLHMLFTAMLLVGWHPADSGQVERVGHNALPLHIVKRGGAGHPGIPEEEPCATWNATISLTASFITKTVEADVRVLSDPGCKDYDVHLWKLFQENPEYGPCTNGIHRVRQVKFQFSELNHIVTFENVTAGNYCVRVEPSCDSSECLTLYSRVVPLPEVTSHGDDSSHKDSNDDYFFLILLLPAAFLASLGYMIVRRKKKNLNSSFVPQVTTICTTRVPDSIPVIRVVYSRDSPQHNEAVACLCNFLEKEVKVRVVYDENAHAHAHLTSDWAIAMADVYCPLFSLESPKSRSVEKILVIESDGGIMKQVAHQNCEDMSLSVTDYTDEMYHITYNALLSRQAQALGDYCHIFVARFSYTKTESRLNLVPEKRYILPKHMEELLSALLHTGASEGNISPVGIVLECQSKVRKMMESEAYRHLLLVLDNMENSLNEYQRIC